MSSICKVRKVRNMRHKKAPGVPEAFCAVMLLFFLNL